MSLASPIAALATALPLAMLLASCSGDEMTGTTAAEGGTAEPSLTLDAGSEDGGKPDVSESDVVAEVAAADVVGIEAAPTETSLADAAAGDVFVACGRFPSCGWIHQSQGGTAFPSSVMADSNGHVILTGAFSGSVSFGGPALVHEARDADFGIFHIAEFVAKFDASGQHEWSQRIGSGTPTGTATAVAATDASGGIVLAGPFETLELGGKTVSSQGTADVFVARLTSAGTYVWSKTYGRSGQYQTASAVAIDANGDAVVAGWFDGTIDFGDGAHVGPAGNRVGFVVKVDSSGTTQWSKAFSADNDAFPGDVAPLSVAIDGAGAVFLAGKYQGSVDLGGGPLPLTPAHWVFLAKLDASGNYISGKGFGSTAFGGDVHAVSMKVNPGGRVLLAGSFASDIDFGGGPLSASSSLGALFVAQLDESASHVWSRAYGNSKSQVWPTVALGAAGDVWLGGVVYSSMTIGECTATGVRVGANGGSGFFAHFDPVGNPLWARGLGLASQGYSLLALGPSDELIVAGMFGGTFDLGCGALTSAAAGAFWGRMVP